MEVAKTNTRSKVQVIEDEELYKVSDRPVEMKAKEMKDKAHLPLFRHPRGTENLSHVLPVIPATFKVTGASVFGRL